MCACVCVRACVCDACVRACVRVCVCVCVCVPTPRPSAHPQVTPATQRKRRSGTPSSPRTSAGTLRSSWWAPGDTPSSASCPTWSPWTCCPSCWTQLGTVCSKNWTSWRPPPRSDSARSNDTAACVITNSSGIALYRAAWWRWDTVIVDGFRVSHGLASLPFLYSVSALPPPPPPPFSGHRPTLPLPPSVIYFVFFPPVVFSHYWPPTPPTHPHTHPHTHPPTPRPSLSVLFRRFSHPNPTPPIFVYTLYMKL